ncbi:MAG: hypothetical protein K6T91_00060 [Firmicutes bacterium]|nr:hypothetical protein [Bacillota bacterium]
MEITAYNDMELSQIEDMVDSWTKQPVSKTHLDPVEAIKITSGYAIEQHQWANYHQLMELTTNQDIKELFAAIGAWEESHQATFGSLVDPETTPLEASLTLQMTAIQSFSDAAQLEPSENCKMTYDYILLDHLTQAKALSDTMSSVGTNPEGVIKESMQLMEGRPFSKQYIPTKDLLKRPLDKNSDNIMSFVNLHTLLANEKQLRNEFQTIRKMLPSQNIRRLYNRITSVETEHVTMLASLRDPNITLLEYAMINELMEIRNHQLGMQIAKNDAAREAFEYALNGDQGHLSWLRDAYSSIEKGDSSKFAIPDNLFATPPLPVNDYVKQVMQTQMGITPKGMGFEKAA